MCKYVTVDPGSGYATVPSPCHWPLLPQWNPMDSEMKEMTIYNPINTRSTEKTYFNVCLCSFLISLVRA